MLSIGKGFFNLFELSEVINMLNVKVMVYCLSSVFVNVFESGYHLLS